MQCINMYQRVGTPGSCVLWELFLRSTNEDHKGPTEETARDKRGWGKYSGSRAAVCFFFFLCVDADKQESSLQTGLCVDLLSAVRLGALQVDTLGVS